MFLRARRSFRALAVYLFLFALLVFFFLRRFGFRNLFLWSDGSDLVHARQLSIENFEADNASLFSPFWPSLQNELIIYFSWYSHLSLLFWFWSLPSSRENPFPTFLFAMQNSQRILFSIQIQSSALEPNSRRGIRTRSNYHPLSILIVCLSDLFLLAKRRPKSYRIGLPLLDDVSCVMTEFCKNTNHRAGYPAQTVS